MNLWGENGCFCQHQEPDRTLLWVNLKLKWCRRLKREECDVRKVTRIYMTAKDEKAEERRGEEEEEEEA